MKTLLSAFAVGGLCSQMCSKVSLPCFVYEPFASKLVLRYVLSECCTQNVAVGTLCVRALYVVRIVASEF
jgi:hypothetical protein